MRSRYQRTADALWDSILRHVRAAAAVHGQRAVARKLGVSPSTVSRWLAGNQGGERRSFQDIIKYCEVLNISANEFFGPLSQAEHAGLEEFGTVPNGCGDSFKSLGRVYNNIAFHKEWLNRRCGGLSGCVVMRVTDRAMEPTLYEGDVVLVDTADTERPWKDNRLYLVRYRGKYFIHRFLNHPGKIVFHSDNPDYPDIEIIDAEESNWGVAGRVLWAGKHF